MAYARSVAPPARESHQKATGTTLAFLRSEAIHCTKNRAEKRSCPRNPMVSHPEGMSRVTASHLVPQPARFHPAHGEKVREGPEDAVPHAVLAGPRDPRPVIHGDLDDAPSFDPDQRGEEPVHPVPELDRREGVRPEGLQRAAGIDDVVAGDAVANPV